MPFPDKRIFSLRGFVPMLSAALLAAWLSLSSLAALAHHVSSGANPGLNTSTTLARTGVTAPTSRAFLGVEATQIDSRVASSYTSLVGGEYSFHRRASVAAWLPLTHLSGQTRDDASGLGDMAVQGRFRLWETKRTFSDAHAQWTFPTGQKNAGLGRGAIGQQLDYALGLRLKSWALFGGTGVNFGYESESEPVILGQAGIQTPPWWNGIAWATLAASSHTHVGSEVFAAGATKIYVEPQVSFAADKRRRWIVTASARVGIADLLERKPGVTFDATNNAFLSDVQYGAGLHVTHRFLPKHRGQRY